MFTVFFVGLLGHNLLNINANPMLLLNGATTPSVTTARSPLASLHHHLLGNHQQPVATTITTTLANNLITSRQGRALEVFSILLYFFFTLLFCKMVCFM